MRIRRVDALAFGTLRGEPLEFADGFTVVHGANESGKSTWHAAVYTGLCGRADAEPTGPMSGSDWELSVQLELDDGREMVLHQVRGPLGHSRASQTDGRDCSAEIERDGALDATRWLGLDPASFAATAWVGQGRILTVLDHLDDLRDLVRRAAASAGGDRDACTVLRAMDDFRRGRSEAARHRAEPLRLAIEEMSLAEQRLADVRRQRSRFDQYVIAAQMARREMMVRRAAAALIEARALADRSDQVDRLSRDIEELDKPPSAEDSARRRQVDEALAAWYARPSIGGLNLYSMPGAGLIVAAPFAATGAVWYLGVAIIVVAVAAVTVLIRSRRASAVPRIRVEPLPTDVSEDTTVPVGGPPVNDPPPVPPQEGWFNSPQPEAQPSEMDADQPDDLTSEDPVSGGPTSRELGSDPSGEEAAGRHFEPYDGEVMPWLSKELRHLGNEDADPHGNSHAMPELDDQLQVELGNPWAAMDDRRRAALEIQRRANEQAQRVAEEQAQRLVEEQAQRLVEEQAQRLAEEQARRLAEEQAQRLAEEQAQRLAEEQAQRLAEEQARRLAEEQARRFAEEQAQRLAEQARIRADEERANGLVSMAAAACGFPPLPAYQAARRLEAWRLEQNQMLAARCRQLEDTKIRQRLLLKGKSAVQVAEEATAAAARAARFGADVDASALAAASQDVAGLALPDHHRSDVERAVADALRHYQDAVEEASRADKAVLAQGRILPPVVEAEEALERATRELARVTELDDILGLAYEFVSTVHEQAVADVGPSLAALMREWLPQLTDHRYTDATVDPMTLEVRVRAEQGHWCDPRELSFATAEQIYLLLRIALICYVTRDGETCPLLLDDVIVHADAARTEQMLTLLQHLARERQVVLFTQQDVVADWARGHLPADGYVPLTRRPAA